MKQFSGSAKVFLHGSDRPLKQGELVRQPELAATIARLQKHGWREFYEGETVHLIDRDMAAHQGTIRYDDLRGYKAIERDPVKGVYRGARILSMPPSSSGGVALIEMLNIFETFPAQLGREGSVEQRHHMIEAMRRAFRDRAEFSGDPDFFTVPVDRLTSKAHAQDLASTVEATRATSSTAVAGDESGRESDDTTHFSVIDEAGNIVSNTYTLNSFYGSQVIARGTGVLLNDIIMGFSICYIHSTQQPKEKGGLKEPPGSHARPSHGFQVLSVELSRTTLASRSATAPDLSPRSNHGEFCHFEKPGKRQAGFS